MLPSGASTVAGAVWTVALPGVQCTIAADIRMLAGHSLRRPVPLIALAALYPQPPASPCAANLSAANPDASPLLAAGFVGLIAPPGVCSRTSYLLCA